MRRWGDVWNLKMRGAENQLVLRSKSFLRGKARPKVVYRHAPAQTQYLVHHTLLEDAALCWSADWLAGLFCVEDFPTEWVAYVHSVLLGPRYETMWEGEKPPFAEALRQQVAIHQRVMPPMLDY